MPQLMRPTTVKVVPKDGEIEITLNINITVDGQVTANADNAKVTVQQEDEDKVEKLIPSFNHGFKVNFGKKV